MDIPPDETRINSSELQPRTVVVVYPDLITYDTVQVENKTHINVYINTNKKPLELDWRLSQLFLMFAQSPNANITSEKIIKNIDWGESVADKKHALQNTIERLRGQINRNVITDKNHPNTGYIHSVSKGQYQFVPSPIGKATSSEVPESDL